MATDPLQSVVLNSTNYFRQKHQAAPVEWNTTLADFAEDHAKTCIWKHSGGPYGENLAANFQNSTLAIDAWAGEESKYDYGKPRFTLENGHFTQLVWKNTTDVGCAVVRCDNDATDGVRGDYLVCEYSPAGNVQGQFGDNIAKPGQGSGGEPGVGAAAAGKVEGVRSALGVVLACHLLLFSAWLW